MARNDGAETPASKTDITRPSPLLLAAGVACLLVAAVALLGLDPLALVHGSAAGWIAVGVAVSVGLAMVLIPGRRNGRS